MSEEKKNPPRAQIFRHFRIESRNNNAQASEFPNLLCLNFLINLPNLKKKLGKKYLYIPRGKLKNKITAQNSGFFAPLAIRNYQFIPVLANAFEFHYHRTNVKPLMFQLFCSACNDKFRKFNLGIEEKPVSIFFLCQKIRTKALETESKEFLVIYRFLFRAKSENVKWGRVISIKPFQSRFDRYLSVEQFLSLKATSKLLN